MEHNKKPPGVTGVGGVFFKCQNPQSIKTWYSTHLGMKTDEYGTLFQFREADSDDPAYLQWSPFDAKTEYFDPSEKAFMINYRVRHIEELVNNLKASGVTVLDDIETFEYGKFVHILDPENNKIELWEPIDASFTSSQQEDEP